MSNANEYFIKANETDLLTLRYLSNRISVEAMGEEDDLKGAVSLIPELFTKTAAFIREKLSKDVFNDSTFKQTTDKVIFGNRNYMAFYNCNVYKCVGQKVKMVDLVNTLVNNHVTILSPFLINLAFLDRTIASFANDPGVLKSGRFDSLISKNDHLKISEGVKQLADCFDQKDKSSTALYKDLYARNADLDKVIIDLSNLISLVKHDDIQQYLKRIESINVSFILLISKIEDKTPGFSIPPATVASLSNLCYTIASYVELLAVHTFKLREVAVAVKDTVGVIKSV